MPSTKKKIDSLKETLKRTVLGGKKQQILGDYHIFMAIAEDISYDAKGRATPE